jgi:transposase
MNLKRIGLDTSKAVFTLHGVDQDEKPVLRRNIRRAGLEAFFTKLPPTVVGLEACGGSHHWGRRLAALGHTVRLIPPQQALFSSCRPKSPVPAPPTQRSRSD